MADVKIKLCGMMRECDIMYANEAMPDYVGFVFAGEKRRISHDSAAAFRKILSDKIPAVGVFVDEDINVVAGLLNEGIINIAQLHGNEGSGYISDLKGMTGCRVIKAVRVTSGDDITDAHKLDADYLLLDAYKKGMPGGTGESFSWDIINKAYHSIPEVERKPFFIAGGINTGNVCEAVSFGPYGVDVSTGIETDGHKDRDKMIEIVRRVRNV